jgi:hypothetical protein
MGSLGLGAGRQQLNMSNSRFTSILRWAGIEQRVLWDRPGTQVVKYTSHNSQLQLLTEGTADPPSVVEKSWSEHRVKRDGGNQQVSAALWPSDILPFACIVRACTSAERQWL